MADDFNVRINGDIDDQIRHFPEVLANAKVAAEHIAAIARETAPVESGLYRDGIIAQATRYGYRVAATDNKSAWIEFGIPSQGKPARFNLRRAVEAAGYKFRKK